MPTKKKKSVPKRLTAKAIAEIQKFFNMYPTQLAACEALGVSASNAPYWISGRNRPSVKVAKRIEELSGGLVRANNIVRCPFDIKVLKKETFKEYVLRTIVAPRASIAGWEDESEVAFYFKHVYSAQIQQKLDEVPSSADLLLFCSIFGSTIEFWEALAATFFEN